MVYILFSKHKIKRNFKKGLTNDFFVVIYVLGKPNSAIVFTSILKIRRKLLEHRWNIYSIIVCIILRACVNTGWKR